MAFRSTLVLSNDSERSFFGDTEAASLDVLWAFVSKHPGMVNDILRIETKEFTECLDSV